MLLRQGADWITGPELRFRRDTETGYFTSPRFYIAENGGRGDAAEIKFVAPDQYEVSDARYTTCVAPNEDWYIRTDQLEIDKTRMLGTGHDATVHFLGVPIAYTPWIEFPLSNERKSGFLTPTLGSSALRGFDASLPYYLNLAPNYDATLTPRVMTKRGVQLGTQFRYLFENAQGGIEADDLPHDRVTGTDRYALSWKHLQNLGDVLPGLSASVNLNKVSDDTYFSDLADRVAFTSLTTLPREGAIAYVNGPWQFRAAAQTFQTLQDPECAGRAAVQPGAADHRLAAGDRLDGAHVGGRRRVRGFPPADAHHRPARLRVADRRLDPTGRRVVGDRAGPARTCANTI